MSPKIKEKQGGQNNARSKERNQRRAVQRV